MNPLAHAPMRRWSWAAFATVLFFGAAGRAAGGWGPKWAWVGVQAREKAKNERLSVQLPFVVNKDKGEIIDIQFDHDGRRTDRTLPVKEGRFTLDGTKDKAIYYEVIFP